MSHHIHMLPQLLPLERTVKPDKKKRLRKTRGGGDVAYTQDVEDVDGIGDFFAPLVERHASVTQEAIDPDEEGDHAPMGMLSGETMNALLRVQEEG